MRDCILFILEAVHFKIENILIHVKKIILSLFFKTYAQNVGNIAEIYDSVFLAEKYINLYLQYFFSLELCFIKYIAKDFALQQSSSIRWKCNCDAQNKLTTKQRYNDKNIICVLNFALINLFYFRE